MGQQAEGSEYKTNDANSLVGELFSGRLTVEEAIERLRTRLLDLSARNRLLNYRHPKGRCIQIADDPGINFVFDRVYVDGNGIPFKCVSEPPPDTYEGKKRPEAKLYADSLGISTSFDFSPNSTNGRSRMHGLQTLLYPTDLERQLRKIAGEAKTAIEETGSNMLFLIFGFLEFYDSEDSTKPMLAPLVSVPTTLVRGGIDENTRTYQYIVQHNGEDLAENLTLREKLRCDFTLSLPDFCEDERPETYFNRIEQAIKKRSRWKVRRQITLGMLSFGKLAIWADLDIKKNLGLPDHPLIKSVFSGASGGGIVDLYSNDYRIDEHTEATQPLIYDADSSQHSAIIDVIAGKNIVINGPPGTGKSQTITNIIAAALSSGKKVLFVSEKLAALEVVRRRLNNAGLGHFCLELHSHKTEKKKFLEDLRARIEARFPAQAQLQTKLSTLSRKKTELGRYAELMASSLHNALGLTLNELFWAAERRRQEHGDLSVIVNAIGFPAAPTWTQDDIESRRSRLAGLSQLYEEIGRFDSHHPWWEFRPDLLAPSDDEAIDRKLRETLEHGREANAAVAKLMSMFSFEREPDLESVAEVRTSLDQIPRIPGAADLTMLTKMFEANADPEGHRSSQVLAIVSAGVTKARGLLESASRALIDGARLSDTDVEGVRKLVETKTLKPQLLAGEIGESLKTLSAFENALEVFVSASRMADAPYGAVSNAAVSDFLAKFENPDLSSLTPFSIRSIATRATAVQPLRDAMDLAYLTGQRPADILRLARTDIREGSLSIRQAKTGARLRISIEGTLADVITRVTARRHSVEALHLVRTEQGQPVTYPTLRARYDKARLAATKKIANEGDRELAKQIRATQFRDLRAKAATEKEERLGIEAAKDQLGHTSSATTRRYVRNRLGKLVTPTK